MSAYSPFALILVFLFSSWMHWYGSWLDFNEQQALELKPTTTFFAYLENKRFLFESFQNWQSEFLSIFAIVFLRYTSGRRDLHNPKK